jgi:hypothetical protein
MTAALVEKLNNADDDLSTDGLLQRSKIANTRGKNDWYEVENGVDERADEMFDGDWGLTQIQNEEQKNFGSKFAFYMICVLRVNHRMGLSGDR